MSVSLLGYDACADKDYYQHQIPHLWPPQSHYQLERQVCIPYVCSSARVTHPKAQWTQGLPTPSVSDICEGELQRFAFIKHESEVLHAQLRYIEERVQEAKQRVRSQSPFPHISFVPR